MTVRLNHAGFIIPNVRHFLSRIYKAPTLLCQYNHLLSPQVIIGLTLWKGFIHYATDGISINNVVFQAANVAVWSNTSLHEIGGYSSNGDAWHWQLPVELIDIFILNTLEFLTCAISLGQALSQSPQGSWYVRITDSVSIAGWLYKSSFDDETHPEHLKIAQFVAQSELKHRDVGYSQHILGANNVIADALSHDFHLSDDALTFLLLTLVPSKIPCSFRISPMQASHTSWV
eukprot:15351421-Ditylum_brightwellii.AAC.1